MVQWVILEFVSSISGQVLIFAGQIIWYWNTVHFPRTYIHTYMCTLYLHVDLYTYIYTVGMQWTMYVVLTQYRYMYM